MQARLIANLWGHQSTVYSTLSSLVTGRRDAARPLIYWLQTFIAERHSSAPSQNSLDLERTREKEKPSSNLNSFCNPFPGALPCALFPHFVASTLVILFVPIVTFNRKSKLMIAENVLVYN